MKYRSDIDGLRALAVLPVVAYHAQLGVPGGFIGVDIFFVISGFLISTILLSEIEDGSFSLANFYERRIRRILPAFLTMLLVTGAVASVILLPADLKEFSASALSALASGGNIYFYLTTNYFSGAAELKPLLHTWSLGVEEQFYILLPVFLILAHRLGRRFLVAGVLLGLVLSSAFSIWLTSASTSGAFYLLPARACEMLLGTALALVPARWAPSRLVANVGGALGLMIICVSYATFSRAIAFPGPWALVPCIGTALVIYAGSQQQGFAAAMLSHKSLVFVGAISYSLYLWHWPLMAFSHYLLIDFTLPVQMALLTLSFALAVLSWRFVERPFRVRSAFNRRQVFAFASVSAVAASCILALCLTSNGWRSRFSEDVLVAADAATEVNSKACLDRSPERVERGDLCVIGDISVEPTALIWGDSHAWSLQILMDEALAAKGRSAFLVSRGGCLPVTGVTRRNHKGPCEATADAVMHFLGKRSIRQVVLIANWSGYVGSGVTLIDNTQPADPTATSSAVLKRRLEKQMEHLLHRNLNLVVMDPLPGAPMEVARSVAISLAFGRPLPPPISRDSFLERNADLFAALDAFQHQVRRVSLWKTICASGSCDYLLDGKPLYTDQNHPFHGNFQFAADAIAEAL